MRIDFRRKPYFPASIFPGGVAIIPGGGARPMEAKSLIRPPHVRKPWAQLLRAVMTLAGPEAELLRHAERAWASVTFSGSRHSLVLQFAGAGGIAAGEAFIAALGEHDFAIPRQLVADAAVVRVEQAMLPEPMLMVEAELLLLESF